PRNTGADDDDVGGLVPGDARRDALRAGFGRADAHRHGASRARGQERSPADIRLRLLVHGRVSPMIVLLWHHLGPAIGGVKMAAGPRRGTFGHGAVTRRLVLAKSVMAA